MEINFWNGQAIIAIFILTHFYYILLLDFSSFDLAYSASEVFPITKTWFPSIWTVHLPHPIPPLSLRMGCLPITKVVILQHESRFSKVEGGNVRAKCLAQEHPAKNHCLEFNIKTMGQRISHITLWLKVLTLWPLRVTSI